MKSQLRHITLLLLALSIALGSVGIALGQQLCQMAMLSSTSKPAQEMKGCCSKSERSDTADDCCTLKVTHKKLDVVSTTKADLLQKVYLAAPAIFPAPAYFLPVPVPTKQVLSYSDSSPPLSGRDILLQKHILRV
ncbi:MAG TPA: hypothetical protein VIG72_04395 [Pontibacter sp.]